MSTSILYHCFCVRQYNYLKTEYKDGETIFHLEKKPSKQRCVDCGSRSVIKKGVKLRKIQTLPIGSRKTFLLLHLHRLQCSDCGALKQESLGEVAFAKKQWSKALGRYILKLLERATVKDVAEHLGLSWDTVKEIHKKYLTKQLKKRSLKELRYIGVDEIAVRKGHNYLTVVLDLQTGEVVWVAEGRKKEALTCFLKKLKRAKAKIKAIAMDMWQPYISAVLEFYPYEVIVFDHYHIISACNKMLDALRRQIVQASPAEEKKYYKGLRYLLLMGEEKLEDNVKSTIKLHQALKMNEALNIAYYLKEELRALWKQPTNQTAGRSIFFQLVSKGHKFRNQAGDEICEKTISLSNRNPH